MLEYNWVNFRVLQHTFILLNARYTEKVTEACVKTDPYVIPNVSWTEEPIALPEVSWYDTCLFLYMILAPNPYMKEEMKVCS